MSDTTFFAILLGGILLSSGVLVGDAYGAVFAKYDGVDGESTDSKHKEWIEVLSIGWDVDTKKKKKKTKPIINSFVISMAYEKSSPKLLEATLTGKVIPKLEIELTKLGCPDRPIEPPAERCSKDLEQVTYLKYEFINVRVTSYDVNASEGTDAISSPPTVILSNNFEEIKVTYTEYDNDTGVNKGNVEAEHKVEKGG